MSMRIGGLASGLDIDSMVKKLMTAEQVPLNKLNQQRQQTEWKREDYRQVSTRLVSFNDKLSTFNLSSSIDAKTATVTGAPGVTAKATGAASNSVLNVEVQKLASATSVIYQGTAGATKISDIYGGSETSIKVGNATINFAAGDDISSLVNKINNSKDSGVTAVYDSKSGSLSLTSKTTGSNAIKLEGGLFKGGSGENGVNAKFTTTGQKAGDDAKVIINGIETTQSSNTFSVNGVDITITAQTPAGQSTQIQVTQDTDKVVDTIKSFVTAYNESLAYMNQEVNEERYRKFLPLTSEQKEAMSDDEIKLWEGKAKSGMLKNDSILNKTVGDMRAALSSDVIVNGQKVNLAQFGITTGAYGEKGKLHIDETKLREALEKDPASATALFGQVNSSDNESNGIFSRIKKINNTALQSLSEKAGTSKVSSDLSSAFLPQSQMGDQLSTYDKRIQTLQDRLTRVETNYYKQFTAMETAMNKYNSTMSSLSGMM